ILIEMFGGSTFDLDRHVRLAGSLLELHSPRGPKGLEDEPAWRSDLAIGSSEGHVWTMFGDEFESPARPQVDLANHQRLARRIPPAGDMLRLRPGLKDLRARGIEITGQLDRVRLTVDDKASLLRHWSKRHIISPFAV